MNPKSSEGESDGEFRMFSKGSDGVFGNAGYGYGGANEDTAFDLDVQYGVPKEVNKAYERANKSLRTSSAQDKTYKPKFGGKTQVLDNTNANAAAYGADGE